MIFLGVFVLPANAQWYSCPTYQVSPVYFMPVYSTYQVYPIYRIPVYPTYQAYPLYRIPVYSNYDCPSSSAFVAPRHRFGFKVGFGHRGHISHGSHHSHGFGFGR